LTEIDEFLLSLEHSTLKMMDKAIALLWWMGRNDAQAGATARQLCEIIERNGYPQQNYSRLEAQLETRRTYVGKFPKTNVWHVHPRGRLKLDEVYGEFSLPKPPRASDSVLSRSLFENTRGYLEKVVRQINGSYDASLYDCCAVMCRRLLETLIIEVYEQAGRSPDIKGASGHFFMFSDLLQTLIKDSAFNVSRNGQKGLEEFKKLGDLSAHNRRFNAQKDDIDRIRDGMRVASEELLHLAKLI
jgi:hypothetical protein